MNLIVSVISPNSYTVETRTRTNVRDEEEAKIAA